MIDIMQQLLAASVLQGHSLELQQDPRTSAESRWMCSYRCTKCAISLTIPSNSRATAYLFAPVSRCTDVETDITNEEYAAEDALCDWFDAQMKIIAESL